MNYDKNVIHSSFIDYFHKHKKEFSYRLKGKQVDVENFSITFASFQEGEFGDECNFKCDMRGLVKIANREYPIGGECFCKVSLREDLDMRYEEYVSVVKDHIIYLFEN